MTTPQPQGQPAPATTEPKPEPIAHCAGCGAEIYQMPAEGEGLPCGH